MNNFPYGSTKQGMDAAFPKEEFDRHMKAAQKKLQEKGIDLLLLTGPENIFWLTGQQTPGFYTFQCLGVPKEGKPFLLLRGLEGSNAKANTYLEDMIPYADDADATEELAKLLKDRGWKGKKIALDRRSYYLTIAQFERLTEACGAMADGSGVIEPLRAVKSPLELQAMDKAGIATEAGMLAGMKAIKIGANENDVAADLVAAQIKNGSEYLGMDPFVCAGPRAGLRHATWRRRKLEEGDAVTLENVACYNRYHVALFRTGMVGQCKDNRLRAMRDACIEGLEAALEKLKPGNTCADVHNAVQAIVDKHGYTDYFRKRCGYSIGLAFGPDWGEGHILSLYHNQPRVLEPGMTFHMPITLSDRGKFTVAASETAVVTEKGNRVFSKIPRAIF